MLEKDYFTKRPTSDRGLAVSNEKVVRKGAKKFFNDTPTRRTATLARGERAES